MRADGARRGAGYARSGWRRSSPTSPRSGSYAARGPSATDEDPTLIKLPRSTSFPSGHSATSAAFAAGVCAELPVMAPLLVPLAGGVAYSRVHTGVHYPSDVAAGVAIGLACAAAARKR